MDAGVVVAIVVGAIGLFLLGVLIGRRDRDEGDRSEPERPVRQPRAGRFERGGALELPEDQDWEARRNREVAEHYDSR
jgi:hypothetical protein